MSKNLLEIQDLTIEEKTSGKKLLESVSFDIGDTKITGIVGESGSGKSITALSLLGLLPGSLKKEYGSAIYYSATRPDLFSLSEPEMNKIRGKEISMIFQEPMSSLNPSMKCGKQVEESLNFHSGIYGMEARSRILDLFHRTGLPSPERIYSSYPHQLSGGQRQRLMIAIALINNPRLLIADEPTTALDVSVQKNIIDLLCKLQEDFMLTVIFISHDLRLLGEIADSIVVMRRGRIVEKGGKEDIFFNPKEAYTKGLLECQPPLEGKPYRLITVGDFESGKPLEDLEEKIKAGEIIKKGSPREIILAIEDLTVIYRQKSGIFQFGREAFKAVDHISLDLYRGETLGLVGESGCGKTTLGKTILMLAEKFSGNITFNGRKLTEMTRREKRHFRKNVQVVFQDPYSSLNPRLRIDQVLTEARKIHFPFEKTAERKEKILSLLTKSGLRNEDLYKYPHEFSGGQRQRIGIVRALVTEPELLILDESVSALDVSVQAQILNLLNDLKKEFSLSYIFISHDLAVVKYMSDRIIVMKEGHFEEEGEASELYKNPRTEYTKRLIAAVPSYQNSSGSS